MSGLTLGTGALVGFERAKRRVVRLVARARERNEPLAVAAGVVGQVWRTAGAYLVRLSTGPMPGLEPVGSDVHRSQEVGADGGKGLPRPWPGPR